MGMGRFQVVVGNVGTVMDVDDESVANAKYLELINVSKDGPGRISGESVTLIKDGEIDKEYIPENYTD